MTQSEFLLNKLATDQDDFSYAVAMQKKASEVGFDWPDIAGVIAKIHEELDELSHEIAADNEHTKLLDELGDVLFACCNLARHLEIDPKRALASSNQKFFRRFNYVETRVVASGKDFSDFSVDELDGFWDEAKALENSDDWVD